jgi:ABC-type antimicrobial peptide transport system permease subunit
VGVVDDERHEGLTGDVREAAYTPVYQVPLSSYAVAVRAEGDPEPLAGPVRRAIAAMDRNLAVYDVSPMSAVVSESLGTSRFSAQLITIFAGVALLLAIVGVYSVASHTVASRRMEMGVRIALGAAPRNIIRVVLVPALGLASLGVAAGLAATAAASRLVASALTDVSPLAPSAYLLAGATVLVATAAATWVPARRASRTDPLESLRAE